MTAFYRYLTVRRSVMCLLVFTTLMVACGGDDDSGDREQPTTTETSTTTATTDPPASDEDAAFPLVEDLELEAAQLADELYQHPEKVRDPDDPDLARMRDIYTDDSPTPDGVTDNLERLADEGLRRRASSSGIYRDLGVYQMVTVDDDTIRFRICSVEDHETVDEEGEVVEWRAQVTQGTGEARRVDGAWRLYGVHPEDDRTIEITPGSAEPGFCDALFAGQEVPQ